MTRLYIGGEKHVFTAKLGDTPGRPLDIVAALPLGSVPSFLAFSPDRSTALCVIEGDDEVASLKVASDGSLTHLSRAPCPGGPAYTSFDPTGRWAMTASYGSGETRVYSVAEDGALSPEPLTWDTGTYSHCAVTDPAGNLIFTPSKGTDTIARAHFDRTTGKCTPLSPVRAPEGSGPRHLIFTARGNRAYLACENDCSLIVYAVEGPDLTMLEHIESLPEGQQPGDTGSDVHLSPDERFVYVSNRGNDSISWFRTTASGVLREGLVSTRGKVPRNFCLLGDDRLIVANQESLGLSVFSRNIETGSLTLVDEVNTPEKPFWVGNASSF